MHEETMHPAWCIATTCRSFRKKGGSILWERLVGVCQIVQIENGEWKMENEAACAAVTGH
jgi:hypothetical protein